MKFGMFGSTGGAVLDIMTVLIQIIQDRQIE